MAVFVNGEGSVHRNEQGLLHRLDGPALEFHSGTKEWYVNGERHREDGPAIETPIYKIWYFRGIYHREGGPAVEWAAGDKEWYDRGRLHRLDGPAIISRHGHKEWWIEDIEYTEEEFIERSNRHLQQLTRQLVI